jgi:hypothetical protein
VNASKQPVESLQQGEEEEHQAQVQTTCGNQAPVRKEGSLDKGMKLFVELLRTDE